MTPSTLDPRPSSPAQQPLPLEDQARADTLRAVFDNSGLLRLGWTFDRALRTPAVRICLQRTAEAVARARARKARRAQRSSFIIHHSSLLTEQEEA